MKIHIKNLLPVSVFIISNLSASNKYFNLTTSPLDNVSISHENNAEPLKKISANELLKEQCPILDKNHDNICQRLLDLMSPTKIKESLEKHEFYYDTILTQIKSLRNETVNSAQNLEQEYNEIKKILDSFPKLKVRQNPLSRDTFPALIDLYKKFIPDADSFFNDLDDFIKNDIKTRRCAKIPDLFDKIACATEFTKAFSIALSTYLNDNSEYLEWAMFDLRRKGLKIRREYENLLMKHAALFYLQYVTSQRAKLILNHLIRLDSAEVIEENFDIQTLNIDTKPKELFVSPNCNDDIYEQGLLPSLFRKLSGEQNCHSNLYSPTNSLEKSLIAQLFLPTIIVVLFAFLSSKYRTMNFHKKITVFLSIFLSTVILQNIIFSQA